MLLRSLLFFLVASTVACAQELLKGTPENTPADDAKKEGLVQMLQDANALLAKDDLDGAMKKIDKVLKIDPRNVAALVLRGAAYSQKRMWNEAQNDYEAAHLINPHNLVVQFNLAELKFAQNQYDAARPGFYALESDHTTDMGDFATYKVFLCDLFGGHDAVAARELDALNQAGTNASYYFANIAWDVVHHNFDDARSWLASADNIFSVQKNGFYAASLIDRGYLPLPPPAGSAPMGLANPSQAGLSTPAVK
jgi:Tfp pilus assembly protein PilF